MLTRDWKIKALDDRLADWIDAKRDEYGGDGEVPWRVVAPLWIGILLANRLTGYGMTPRPEDHKHHDWHVHYASTLFGLQQHYVWSILDGQTLCGLPTEETSTGKIRTPIGITCWRCALRAKGIQK